MVGRGAFYIMLSRLAFVLSGYAIHVSMAHLLTPLDYGTLGVVVGLITLWRVFLSAGLPQTATRFIASDEQQGYFIWRQALKMQMLAAVGLWAIYLLATPLWLRLLNDSSLTPHILLSSFLIPLMAWYQVNLGYFVGRSRFNLQAVAIGLYSVVRVALAVAFALIGMRIYGVILGMTLATVLVGVLTHVTIPRQSRTETPLPDWRKMVSFSLPLILVSFGISALLNLDLLQLKRYFPQSDIIGYYNGAVNLGKAPYWVLSAFATTILPSVAKALGAGDKDAARRLVEKHTSYVVLIGLPCAALVIPSAAKLLDLIYPEKYAAAASALGVLMCSGTALALLALLTSAVTAAGRPQVAMVIVLGCTVAQFLAGVVLVPRYGMLGTATANLITVSLGVAASVVVVHQEFRGVFEFSRVAKGTLAAVVVGGLLSILPGYPLLLLPVLYGVGVALYGGLLVVLGALTPAELQALRRIARLDRPGRVEAAPPADQPR